jgi:hypothetical protein
MTLGLKKGSIRNLEYLKSKTFGLKKSSRINKEIQFPRPLAMAFGRKKKTVQRLICRNKAIGQSTGNWGKRLPESLAFATNK